MPQNINIIPGHHSPNVNQNTKYLTVQNYTDYVWYSFTAIYFVEFIENISYIC